MGQSYGQNDGRRDDPITRWTFQARGKKTESDQLKWSQNAPFASFLFENFSGESLGPPLSKLISITQPYCSTVAYIAPRLVYKPVPSRSEFSFWIHHWQCAFLAQFYKRYSLVWVSLKGLICTPYCTVLLRFFQQIFGGGPRTPTYRRGDPSPTRPFGPQEDPPQVGF